MRWRDVPPLHQSPKQQTPSVGESLEQRQNPSVGDHPQQHSPTADDPTPETKSVPTTHYFTILLTAGYYTLAVPYRPERDQTTNQYRFRSNVIQKCLCYVCWTLSILNRVTTIRRSLHSSHSAISYFQLTHSFVHMTMYVIYFTTITFKSNQLLKSLNSIKSSHLLTLSPTRNSTLRWILLSSQSIWLAFNIVSPVLGYEIINSSCWTFGNLIRGYLSHGRFMFFVAHSENSSYPNATTSYSSVDVLMASAQVLVTTSHLCVLFFIVCLFGCYSVTLWGNVSGFYDSVVGCFSNDVESGNDGGGLSLKEAFSQLRSVACSVNGTWHLLSFWYLIDLTSWLSTELDFELTTTDVFVKIHIFCYLVYIGGGMCFSAEAFRKMEKLKCMARNYCDNANVPKEAKEEVDNVLRCIEVVGVGEVGLFKLNYAFIGQMTGLIITYYIISVDEKTGKEWYIIDGLGGSGGCVF